jgi:RNA polymerase sigma-70 factor (ECF subfamily)
MSPAAPAPSDSERQTRAAEERGWVEAALDGDNKAFGKLVERYQKKVYGLAFGILRNREDAWDVAQDAFVKAYKNLSTFEGNAAFYTWLYRITYNLSLDVLRSKGRRVAEELTEQTQEAAGEDAGRPEHPSETAERRELAEVVKQAMSKLTEKHRAIIVLREIEGLSYEEMAEVLQISKGTVMSRLFHARRNLAALIEPYLKEGQAALAGT